MFYDSIIADYAEAKTALLSNVCLSVYRRDILYVSNVYRHICHTDH